MTERNAPGVRDEEVRSYVRRRMADDLPPEFMGDVMTDVRQTDQRRRGGVGWPILAGLATAAAAIVLVVVGLGLVQRDDVGASPTASASASESETASESASASASASDQESPTGSPSADPTTAEGEFGPVHAMTAEEAFGQDAQACENANPVVNGERSDIVYAISFPAGWSTNQETPERSPCTVFASEPFELGPGGAVPASAAITIDIPFGGDFDPNAPSIDSGGSGDRTVTTTEHTVDGVAALRYEYAAEDGSPPQVIWVVAVLGNLPGPGNDRPYLFLAAPGSTDPARATELNDIVDRMVATLDIGQ